MTNLALSTLVIVALAFPGYVLRSSYYAATFTRQVLPRNWTDDMVRAILYSVPLHVVGVSVFEYLQHSGWIQSTLNFLTAFRLVTGEYGDSFHALVKSLYVNKHYLLFYYVAVLASAFMLGHLFRLAVWLWELDVNVPWLLKFKNDWLYTLMGRGIPAPYKGARIYTYIDALTHIPAEVAGNTTMYRGVVYGFTTEESGALRDILLTEASRGKFLQEAGEDPKFYWKPITPGELMILKYSEIRNLNITYLVEAPQTSSDPGGTAETPPSQKG